MQGSVDMDVDGGSHRTLSTQLQRSRCCDSRDRVKGTPRFALQRKESTDSNTVAFLTTFAYAHDTIDTFKDSMRGIIDFAALGLPPCCLTTSMFTFQLPSKITSTCASTNMLGKMARVIAKLPSCLE